MKSIKKASAKVTKRAWRYLAADSGQHTNVRVIKAYFAALSEAHCSNTDNRRRCDMNAPARIFQNQSSSAQEQPDPSVQGVGRRSTYEIAYTGLEDLYEVQDAFTELHAIFTVMLERFHQDSPTHAFAQLGIARVEDWSDKVCQWSECMDNELDGFPAEGVAYRAKCLRLAALRRADETSEDEQSVSPPLASHPALRGLDCEQVAELALLGLRYRALGARNINFNDPTRLDVYWTGDRMVKKSVKAAVKASKQRDPLAMIRVGEARGHLAALFNCSVITNETYMEQYGILNSRVCG